MPVMQQVAARGRASQQVNAKQGMELPQDLVQVDLEFVVSVSESSHLISLAQI